MKGSIVTRTSYSCSAHQIAPMVGVSIYNNAPCMILLCVSINQCLKV